MKKEIVKEEIKKEAAAAKTEIRNPNLYNLSRSNKDLIQSNSTTTENFKFIQSSNLKSVGEQFDGGLLHDTAAVGKYEKHTKIRVEDDRINLEKNLRLHFATHDPIDLICPECNRAFSRLASFKSHLTIHEEEVSNFR